MKNCCDCCKNESNEPDDLVSFTVNVFEEDGDLWVNFENLTDGGSGNDPLEDFLDHLRGSAKDAQRQASERKILDNDV